MPDGARDAQGVDVGDVGGGAPDAVVVADAQGQNDQGVDARVAAADGGPVDLAPDAQPVDSAPRSPDSAGPADGPPPKLVVSLAPALVNLGDMRQGTDKAGMLFLSSNLPPQTVVYSTDTGNGLNITSNPVCESLCPMAYSFHAPSTNTPKMVGAFVKVVVLAGSQRAEATAYIKANIIP